MSNVCNIITPSYCPYCGLRLRIETIGQRRFNKYKYFCDNPKCVLVRLQNKRVEYTDKYHLVPIFAEL
jgi:hypothetical protein